jgi:hypothetical protein
MIKGSNITFGIQSVFAILVGSSKLVFAILVSSSSRMSRNLPKWFRGSKVQIA